MIAETEGQAGLATLRAERLRRATWSIAVEYLARGLALVISLVSVPLTLNYLDKERYGLWLTVSSIVAYLSITDLGLGLGLQNRVAETRGGSEEAKTGELLSTAFAVMAVGGILVAAAAVAATWLVPLGQWFHITSPQLERELRGTLTVTALTFAYLLPVRMILSAQTGFQEAYVGGLWGIGGSIMSLAALLLVIALKGGMVSLALAIFLLAQPMNLANVWHFLRRHPQVAISWKKVNLGLLRPLFVLGWQFFVLNLYTLVLWNFDNLIIATQKGAADVVPYAVAFRLMWTAFSILSAIPVALWPAFSEARARGDWMWINSVYRRTTLLTVALAAVMAIVFWSWGQEFVRVWVGPRAQGTGWMMTGLSVYLVLGQWSMCNGVLLNATGWPRILLVGGFFDAGVKLGLSLYLVRVWGLAGVAWGTALASLLIPSWFLTYSVRKVTTERVLPPLRETMRALLIISATGLLLANGIQAALPTTWSHAIRVGVGGGLTTFLLLILLIFVVLRGDSRRELAKHFLTTVWSSHSKPILRT